MSKMIAYKRKPKVYKKKIIRKKLVTPNLKQLVKREIHRQIEHKKDWNGGAGNINQSITGVINTTFIPTLPVIVQGVGQGNRLGDEITVISSVLNLTLWVNPYSVTTNFNQYPQLVRIMVLKQKQLTAGTSIPSATDQTSFFELGSSSIGFVGQLNDITRNINTNMFTIKYNKVVKLGAQSHVAGDTSVQSLKVIPNNDFKLQVTLRIPVGKYMKKKLKYDDVRYGNLPSNDNLFIVVQPVNFNNLLTGEIPIAFNWEQHTTYEDA